MHSVDKSQIPRFIPILPPNAEERIRAEARIVPVNMEMHQLVLADTPPVEIVTDIIPPEIGGVTTLTENILELHPEGYDQTSPTDSYDAEQGIDQHNAETPIDITSPDLVGEHSPSPSLLFPTPTTVNTITEEHVERNSQEKLKDYFRTGNGILKRPSEQGATFVTFNTPLVTTPTQRVSCTESITAVLAKHKSELHVEPSANVSVREALRTRGDDARLVINKELQQMINKKVWAPVLYNRLTAGERAGIIRSSMFLKRKTHPDGRFDKYKARLVAGGDQQDKNLYDDLSSPTVSTSAVFTIAAVCAHEHRHAAVVGIGGAFLNASITTGVPVHMRLDKTISDFLIALDGAYSGFTDDKGRIVVLLKKALYGCVESAALWYGNLSKSMTSLGYKCNDSDICVFNRTDSGGVQCTATVHVDDLFITSKSKAMISELTEGLKARYGEITLAHGPLINYLGMAFDFSHTGEARLSMSGYIDEMLDSSGVQGIAKNPATDGLFEIRPDAVMVTEGVRVWFHRVTAQLVYLSKRVKPECLTAVAYLATRVTRCSEDDVDKLHRLVRYIRWSRDTGLVFRPGSSGISVRLFVDASYGVHADGKSHTGSCVVTCMALVERGRSGTERTHHIQIRYFWVKERYFWVKERVVPAKCVWSTYGARTCTQTC